ncbi:uncharacterized protein [Amphiura filiformis]|uniref:uncharacterized protein n=1 Tax=Amphiura filiformis TaxID=82378 RepID=UPI003B217670
MFLYAKMMISTRLTGLVLVLLHLAPVSAISAIVSPTSKSVFVNGNVEFQCQMRNDEGYSLVWIFDYDVNDDIWASIGAQQTTSIDHNEDGHGDYSVEYSKDFIGSNEVHNLILKINGIQFADEGAYTCGYVASVFPFPYRVAPVGNWATLTILIPPVETNPRCRFSPNPTSLNTDSVIATLICEMAGGSPPPDLTWYKEGSSTMSVSSTTSMTNTFAYTITGNDNGIQFKCVASGPALRQDGSCSITPLLVNPSVSISSSADPVVENSDVIFTCVGSGLPYISKLNWLYNGQLVSDNNLPSGFQIIDMSDGSSELHLFSIQLDNNNYIVACYVETPSGLSNQQSITISVIKYVEVKTTTSASKPMTTVFTSSVSKQIISTETMKESEEISGLSTSLLIPIVTAAGGVIVLLVIAILVTVIWKRRKSSAERNRENPQTEIVLEGRRDNTYQMGAVSADNELRATPSEEPAESAYVINQILEMNASGGEPRSVTMGSDHPYDALNFNSRQPETRTPTSAVNRQAASPYASNIVGNAERLSYAELDMSNGGPNARRQEYPLTSSVGYAVIEGEL